MHLSLTFFVLVACPGAVQETWSSGLCSASAPHNHTIRTHRISCYLWSSTYAFAVCVTVLDPTTITLCCFRHTTFQYTVDRPRITYIILSTYFFVSHVWAQIICCCQCSTVFGFSGFLLFSVTNPTMTWPENPISDSVRDFNRSPFGLYRCHPLPH